MGGRQPPDPTVPLHPPWPGCREGQGRGTQFGMGVSLCFPGGHRSLAALLAVLGTGHAWDTALDPGPLQRARHGCLLRGKATEGRSQGSREQHGNAAGKGMLWGNSTGGGHREGGGGSASPVACSYLKSPVCCCLPQETVVWGWHWAKWEGQGREGARCPAGISPAALSEIAWINKHESCWEMRGSGQGQHSSYPLCKSCGGRKGEEKALGLLIPRRIWMDGRVSGLGLSCRCPEPQLGLCPRGGLGDRAGQL